MENLNQHLHTGHFRYLKESAIRDPFTFIQAFCTLTTTIELFRQDNLNLFYAACTRMSDFNGKFHKRADEYVYIHKQLIEVLEVLWVLHQQQPMNLGLLPSHHLYQTSQWKQDDIDLELRLNSSARYYRKLENHEINDIMLFLKDLFLYRNLDEWRELLDDILSYAHIDQSIGSAYDMSGELIPIAEYLEKISEAIFLIPQLIAENEDKKVNEQIPGFQESTAETTATILAANDDSINEAILTDLNDPNFTDGLIAYLSTFWSHLEESATHTNGPVMFSSTLEEELISYFESFHPKFLSRNFRRIYMGYLEHLFQTGTPHYYDEMSSFTAHMDAFFELLDLAETETAHWPQENRIGW